MQMDPICRNRVVLSVCCGECQSWRERDWQLQACGSKQLGSGIGGCSMLMKKLLHLMGFIF